LTADGVLDQAAISSSVRRHPVHHPAAASIRQTPVQGLGGSLGIAETQPVIRAEGK